MNKKFSIKRLASMIKSEICTKYRIYALVFTVVLLPFVWDLITSLIFQGVVMSNDVGTPIGGSITIILIILSPFMLYKELYHPVKGLSFMLKPISSMERFLTILIQTVIIIPISLGLWFLLLNIIFGKSIPEMLDYINSWKGFDTFSDYLGLATIALILVFGPQAAVLWGTCFFKKNKMLKTILVGVVLVSLFVWCVMAFADRMWWPEIEISEASSIYLAFTASIVVLLGIYAWSYRLLRIRQV